MAGFLGFDALSTQARAMLQGLRDAASPDMRSQLDELLRIYRSTLGLL